MYYAVLLLSIVLSACVNRGEQVNTMLNSYVGAPLTALIAQYGPPQTSFETTPGRRTFQWEMAGQYQSTGAVVPLSGLGITMIRAPQVHQLTCRLTVGATTQSQTPTPADWLIESWQVAGNGC
jgi:hypothetical protein